MTDHADTRIGQNLLRSVDHQVQLQQGGATKTVDQQDDFLPWLQSQILDDSTSAIDSATEDQNQRALRRILKGRTTLLITPRISQIRWADRILVLRGGALAAQGTHNELMASSEAYRRIFARYDHAN